MATVDEILETMPEESGVVASSDEILVIDPNTRQINIPSGETILGVEFDSVSDRKVFVCPRFVGNDLDLASCFIRINYRNANGDVDSYLVDDITVTSDTISFVWVVSRSVVSYKGQVKFNVCFVQGSGYPQWHTTLATGVVLEGQEPYDEMIKQETADVVVELLNTVAVQTDVIKEAGAGEVSNVAAEGGKQTANITKAGKAAMNAAVREIEAKGVNTLESIPDDYTALSEAVDGLTRTTAPGIVCETSGTSVYVEDASDQAVRGLRIFGKSTQDGVPTPDAPVEIVSVESPVVTVAGKNLVKNGATSGTQKGVEFVVNEDGSFTAKGTSTGEIYFGIDFAVENVLPGVRYRLNGCPAGGSSSTYRLYAQTSDGKNFAGDVGMGTSFTGTSDQWQVLFVIYGGATVDFTVRPMLRLASIEDDTYESYSGQRVELTHTLPGIPVTSGGNYTDSDGQSWVCDEVDLERGVYVQRIKTDTVTISSRGVLDNGLSAGIYKAPDKLRLLAAGAFCDRAKFVGISGSAKNPNCFYENLNNFGFTGLETDTLEMLQAAYDGATVTYILATPIETPLTEAEIAAYRALHTNYPNTTVLNDSGAHMVVKYTADTKRYIDNKIAALVGG